MGRVALPSDEKNPEELRLDIYYDYSSLVFDYLERNEGIVGAGTRVSTTTVAADGSFATEVPDFASDRVVAASRSPGRLRFIIRALRSYNGANQRSTVAGIVGQPASRVSAGIPMASSYPEPIALELHWR